MYYNIDGLMKKLASSPKQTFIWSGIKDVSFGFIFGAPKTGKTIFCENLLQSISAGREEFWGLPLPGKPLKTIYISLEEYILNRATRTQTQMATFSSLERTSLEENYFVNDENFPTFFTKKSDWDLLEDVIVQSQAKVVIIDSLTRLCNEKIENSDTALPIIKGLREMAYRLKISIIMVHHSIKVNGVILDQNAMAGSRVLAAEADFIFGLSKTPKGDRYLKEVSFRYIPEDSEKVQVYKINEDLWLEPIDSGFETKLLKADDKRFGSALQNEIVDFVNKKSKVETKEIISHFLAKDNSERTIKYSLRSLVDNGSIFNRDRGIYTSEDSTAA